jgi:hypothetical protein
MRIVVVAVILSVGLGSALSGCAVPQGAEYGGAYERRGIVDRIPDGGN